MFIQDPYWESSCAVPQIYAHLYVVMITINHDDDGHGQNKRNNINAYRLLRFNVKARVCIK